MSLLYKVIQLLTYMVQNDSDSDVATQAYRTRGELENLVEMMRARGKSSKQSTE